MKRRNTPQKKTVLSVFDENQTCLCQDDIEKKIGDQMDRVTIYRILNRFCEDGLMHKITGKNGKSFFALQNDEQECLELEPHYHFHCEVCNQMICLEEKVNIVLKEEFSIHQTNCVISGICPQCKK